MEDTYLTIESNSQGLYKEKGSKFLSFAFSVSSEQEIREIVKQMKQEYFDARHHCYAYILGVDKSVYRMNDDGEPSSSAGRPIYGQLLSRGLTDILVIVVRYFGGTKLGVSGLIQAYKSATIDALDNAQVVEKTIDEVYGVYFEYVLMNDVMKVLKDFNLEQRNHSFEDECYLEFIIRKSEAYKVVEKLKKILGVNVELI